MHIIFIKMNTFYYKPRKHVLQFQCFHEINFYRVIKKIYFFLNLFTTPTLLREKI